MRGWGKYCVLWSASVNCIVIYGELWVNSAARNLHQYHLERALVHSNARSLVHADMQPRPNIPVSPLRPAPCLRHLQAHPQGAAQNEPPCFTIVFNNSGHSLTTRARCAVCRGLGHRCGASVIAPSFQYLGGRNVKERLTFMIHGVDGKARIRKPLQTAGGQSTRDFHPIRTPSRAPPAKNQTLPCSSLQASPTARGCPLSFSVAAPLRSGGVGEGSVRKRGSRLILQPTRLRRNTGTELCKPLDAHKVPRPPACSCPCTALCIQGQGMPWEEPSLKVEGQPYYVQEKFYVALKVPAMPILQQCPALSLADSIRACGRPGCSALQPIQLDRLLSSRPPSRGSSSQFRPSHCAGAAVCSAVALFPAAPLSSMSQTNSFVVFVAVSAAAAAGVVAAGFVARASMRVLSP